MYQMDRVARREGGLCIYVKSDLLVNTRNDIANGAKEVVESLWLELQSKKTNEELIMGVCYMSPNLKDEEETDLLSQLEMATRQRDVIIMEDFNYPDIDWADETAQSCKAHHFLNVLQVNFLCQLMDATTIIKALLDHLITNIT